MKSLSNWQDKKTSKRHQDYRYQSRNSQRKIKGIVLLCWAWYLNVQLEALWEILEILIWIAEALDRQLCKWWEQTIYVYICESNNLGGKKDASFNVPHRKLELGRWKMKIWYIVHWERVPKKKKISRRELRSLALKATDSRENEAGIQLLTFFFFFFFFRSNTDDRYYIGILP